MLSSHLVDSLPHTAAAVSGDDSEDALWAATASDAGTTLASVYKQPQKGKAKRVPSPPPVTGISHLFQLASFRNTNSYR